MFGWFCKIKCVSWTVNIWNFIWNTACLPTNCKFRILSIPGHVVGVREVRGSNPGGTIPLLCPNLTGDRRETKKCLRLIQCKTGIENLFSNSSTILSIFFIYKNKVVDTIYRSTHCWLRRVPVFTIGAWTSVLCFVIHDWIDNLNNLITESKSTAGIYRKCKKNDWHVS